jgi:hypothetical protein
MPENFDDTQDAFAAPELEMPAASSEQILSMLEEVRQWAELQPILTKAVLAELGPRAATAFLSYDEEADDVTLTRRGIGVVRKYFRASVVDVTIIPEYTGPFDNASGERHFRAAVKVTVDSPMFGRVVRTGTSHTDTPLTASLRKSGKLTSDCDLELKTLKMAETNAMIRALVDLSGLGGLTTTELREAGIDPAAIRSAGKKSGPAAAGARPSSKPAPAGKDDSADLVKQIIDALASVGVTDSTDVDAVVTALSAFVGKDGEVVPGRDLLDLSAARLYKTAQRVKGFVAKAQETGASGPDAIKAAAARMRPSGGDAQ